ncbi:MAG: hypothetical protein LUD52_05215 [Opitutae bacterium]|nr:hypothetical protein [Opitutae bacterium]
MNREDVLNGVFLRPAKRLFCGVELSDVTLRSHLIMCSVNCPFSDYERISRGEFPKSILSRFVYLFIHAGELADVLAAAARGVAEFMKSARKFVRRKFRRLTIGALAALDAIAREQAREILWAQAAPSSEDCAPVRGARPGELASFVFAAARALRVSVSAVWDFRLSEIFQFLHASVVYNGARASWRALTDAEELAREKFREKERAKKCCATR